MNLGYLPGHQTRCSRTVDFCCEWYLGVERALAWSRDLSAGQGSVTHFTWDLWSLLIEIRTLASLIPMCPLLGCRLEQVDFWETRWLETSISPGRSAG